jgi:hypothetical protein
MMKATSSTMDDKGQTHASLQLKKSTSATMSANLYIPTANEMRMQKEINALRSQHKNEMYWMQLELDTTRREKEAAEDRLTEFLRDLHDGDDTTTSITVPPTSNATPESPTSPLDSLANTLPMASPTVPNPATSSLEWRKQAEKYDRMIRIMNNQMQLIRNSCDNVVKSLKEEISDIMDDKCTHEMELINQLSVLEKEKCEVEVKLAQREKEEAVQRAKSSRIRQEDMRKLQSEVRLLIDDKKKIEKELVEERLKTQTMQVEKQDLVSQLEKLKGDLALLQSSPDRIQGQNKTTMDRDEIMTTLDRVSSLWERADASMQHLETTMNQYHLPDGGFVDSVDHERTLSMMETTSLLHGQIKVTMMLIEVKLRNNLACLGSEHMQVKSLDPASQTLQEQVQAVQNEAMLAIAHVESALEQHFRELEEQSVAEAKAVRDLMEHKVNELRRIQSRQRKLEEDVALFRKQGAISQQGKKQSLDSSKDLYVSRKVLQRLQNEVLQVVDRVREKNDVIDRLSATIDSFKAREEVLVQQIYRLQDARVVYKDDREEAREEGNEKEVEEVLEVDEEEEEVVESSYEEVTVAESDIVEEDPKVVDRASSVDADRASAPRLPSPPPLLPQPTESV